MRRVPGSRAATAAKGSRGGGTDQRSTGVEPEMTSRSRALSRTLRDMPPRTTSPYQCCDRGATEMRPRVGLRPTSPQAEAGMRIDPPPSAPSATGTVPVATATADPPDEPPGERSRSKGLRVTPVARLSVNGNWPNSGIVVRPTMTAPAARRRRTTSLSAVRGVELPAPPRVVTSPVTSYSSLTTMGTPARGRSALGPTASSSSASASALSARTTVKALTGPLRSSMRARAACTVSRALMRPSRTAAAVATASRVPRVWLSMRCRVRRTA
jgi:hypothetical protein